MLAIVDYKAGNLTSVKLALDTIGVPGTITSDPQVIASADKIIFPGVGAAGAAMKNLRQLGLVDVLRDAVLKKHIPLLGICVGLQVLLDYSEEDGGTETLGLIPGRVVKFSPANHREKVPQIGWNSVTRTKGTQSNPLLFPLEIEDAGDFYFVHSYYAVPKDKSVIAATTEYAGTTFASVLHWNNLVAVQFHPEKSGVNGLRLLYNFCDEGSF